MLLPCREDCQRFITVISFQRQRQNSQRCQGLDLILFGLDLSIDCSDTLVCGGNIRTDIVDKIAHIRGDLVLREGLIRCLVLQIKIPGDGSELDEILRIFLGFADGLAHLKLGLAAIIIDDMKQTQLM